MHYFIFSYLFVPIPPLHTLSDDAYTLIGIMRYHLAATKNPTT